MTGRIIAYGDDRTERYLLFRLNQNVIASIKAGGAFVDGLGER